MGELAGRPFKHAESGWKEELFFFLHSIFNFITAADMDFCNCLMFTLVSKKSIGKQLLC